MKYLIVGLGNIGHEYTNTRHNVGFMIMDAFAKQAQVKFSIARHAYYSELNTRGRHVYLIKPTTFMNLSGKAVSYWKNTLNIPIENVLVIVDDIALSYGVIRLKPAGSSGGHNGLKSIESSISSSQYPRLRFGIGAEFSRGRQSEYVLGKFKEEEEDQLSHLIDRSIAMINSFLFTGLTLTMTNYN